MRPLVLGILVAIFSLLLDQWSKWLAMQELADRSITLLEGFFDLILVRNYGAAFGLFGSLPVGWREGFLMAVAVVASVFILHLLRQSHSRLEGVALGLILGGAIGNLLDRYRYGWVVDFFHAHWHDLSWPVFNVADSGITLGVAILLWINLFHSSHQEGPS
ncbi:MAG: signal peptidase II [Magnetococcales bacterium]|nr:signal peptidase II [Magnetococcales bacterium]